MTSININYYILLKASMIFLLIGNLARSLSPVIAALFEFSLIVLMLFFTTIYLAQTKKIFSNNELIYYSFLLYLILHLFAASIFRPLELQHSFYDIFYYNLSEFNKKLLSQNESSYQKIKN